MTLGVYFDDDLAAAKRGDRGALERIYRDVAPLVIGYLRANGAIDPEDTASDVFVAMVGKLASFEGDERQFRSWLLTITHRRLVDGFRRRGRRREAPYSTEQLAERSSRTVDGEVAAMQRLRTRGVLAAIDKLTPDQRSAMMLRVLADLPVADIARILGKPESAVKALLRRASAAMARMLQPDEAAGSGSGDVA